jgi:serine kinase of HPr protein (carbohydrate metabolism regulator)
MKLELNLMELNELYYVVSKGVEKHRELVETAKDDTPELRGYFDRELNKSVQLLDKIQTSLYDEVNKLDNID